MNSTSIAIMGTTSWGITLGLLLAEKGLEVRLWARSTEEAKELNQRRESPRLPGFTFPPQLRATSSLNQALSRAGLIVLAVPAQSLRWNIRQAREHLEQDPLILSVAKGLEAETGLRMSQVIAEELPHHLIHQFCILSGPNLAREIVRHLPAATVVAGDTEAAQQVHELLSSPRLRVEVRGDIVGVELGGALKNVVAVGAGMVEGLGWGDNAKAAFVAQFWGEVLALSLKAGAELDTLNGLAGLGDLIVTCFSPLSRNHQLGLEMGRGVPLKQVRAALLGVAEGVATTKGMYNLMVQLGLCLPLCQALYQVLFEAQPPGQALGPFLSAEAI